MHHYGVGADGKIRLAPDAFIEVFRGEDLAAVLHHQAQQAVFQFRQRKFAAILEDLVEALVHAQAVCTEAACVHGFLLAAVDVVAPQKRLDAREQFGVGEGLGQVIVAAGGEAEREVGVHAPGGEEEDGHVGSLADAGAGLVAGKAGHHHVEDDEIDARALSEQVKGGFAAVGLQNGVALAGEQKFQQFADLRVVVHKEDGGAHSASFLIIAVCSEIWPYVFLKNP